MAQIIILAGSVQEAARYTRKADLPRGRFICPMSASQIDGVVPSEVHTLPGFHKRRDTHAILATVKRRSKRYQHVKFIDIDDRGPLTARQIVVAHRYNALVDGGIPENVDPVIAMASVEVTPEDIVAEEADGTHESDWDAEGDALDDLRQAAEVLSNVDAALEAPKRRASLCKVCDTKHIKGQDCPGPAIFE